MSLRTCLKMFSLIRLKIPNINILDVHNLINTVKNTFKSVIC